MQPERTGRLIKPALKQLQTELNSFFHPKCNLKITAGMYL